MQTVKQAEASCSCVLACAAMICGRSLAQIFDEYCALKGGRHAFIPAVGLRDLLWVLLSHGKIPGLVVNWERGVELDLDSIGDLEVHCGFDSHDAIVSVEGSLDYAGYHAVVWDRHVMRVRDPLPHLPETTELKHYRVVQWIPITSLEETGWMI